MGQNEPNQLKPCPFCGGKAYVYVDTFDSRFAHDLYSVFCEDCECEIKLFDTEKEAIEFWNNRT